MISHSLKPIDKIFNAERSKLEAVGYRMLGTKSDAEDVVQDCYLRWSQHWQKRERSVVLNPGAFLMSTVTRLCLDKLRKRKVEQYVGPWLPEPIQTDHDPEQRAELVEAINTGFLLVLESLSPLERAVFTLFEAFEYSHQEIGNLLGLNMAHSRQLLLRARRKVALHSPPGDAAGREIEPIVSAFFEAALEGDMDTLTDLLCEDVIAYSDGGGKASAAIIPLVGVERVITVFRHLIQNDESFMTSEWREVNGQHGLVIFFDGKPHSVTTLDTRDGKIQRIYVVRNPNKLKDFSLE